MGRRAGGGREWSGRQRWGGQAWGAAVGAGGWGVRGGFVSLWVCLSGGGRAEASGSKWGFCVEGVGRERVDSVEIGRARLAVR